MLRDSVAVVVPTRPRAIPHVMITMRKSIHGLPFLSYMGMGLHLSPRYAHVMLVSGYLDMTAVN